MAKKELLYLRIAGAIERQIRNNVLKAGDKLLSLRSICNEYRVSMNTAVQAYLWLESKGLIETKPRSGYFVSLADRYSLPVPQTSKPLLIGGKADIDNILDVVMQNRKQCKITLSAGAPGLELLPVAKLNKAMMHAMRQLPDNGINYDYAGNDVLKQQIAKRSRMWDGRLGAQDILTTSGSIEAITLCLHALVRPGDTIAMESPVFNGFFQLAKILALNVIELPTNPVTGVEPEALKKVLGRKKISACILVSNFSNPLGSLMPDEHKQEVVRLMEKHNVPLIEDDLFGDLYFGPKRPVTCKTYDESGLVLWCGSFSKTLASGYRVGWVAPGKFMEKVARIKRNKSLSTNAIAHAAIAWFLQNERYDLHLRKLRQTLQANRTQLLRCIGEYFPEGTKATQPQGGFTMWVELHKKAQALTLYDKAVQQKINFNPGALYTLQQQYGNCLRLSYGMKWNEKIESALKVLGRLARDC